MLTPQIARKVMDQFRRLSPTSEVGPGESVPSPADEPRSGPIALKGRTVDAAAQPLNEKEQRILELIVEGRSNRQIAKAIYLAEGTVKNYVTRIMEKFHANTRTELAVMSVRQQRHD
jgi:DNA-binding NarL/FixJ family response regulator